MKPLVLAHVPPEEDERAFHDMMLLYDKNPSEVLALAHLPRTASRAAVEKSIRALLADEREKSAVWLNDVYQVSVRRQYSQKAGAPNIVHLSIKRIDRQPCRDWRDFQAIKSQLVGPECEGMELYPAESRLVDTANQYHMWVIDDPTFRYPWGFDQRAVIGPTDGTKSKQRPL